MQQRKEGSALAKIEQKFGYVECIFAYGKCGFVRELCGEAYYFNSRSFAPGRRRLHFGEPVRFRTVEIPDGTNGGMQTVAVELRSEVNPYGIQNKQ